MPTVQFEKISKKRAQKEAFIHDAPNVDKFKTLRVECYKDNRCV